MNAGQVIALSGGIGGAKLALGLYRVLGGDQLTVIVNTGDDFEHLGLTICPDLDTVLYTLAGVSNSELGWGRVAETWTFMRALEALGGETWFRLGDADLALHVERTRRLGSGESLSYIISDFARRLGISANVVPASDDPVRTRVITASGELAFQDYFVRQRCAPSVKTVRFAGAASAAPAPGVLRALTTPGKRAIILCPSNPFLSVAPILAVPGMAAGLLASGAPIVAVTPLIGGEAVKGPTAKIMAELGLPLTPCAVAQHYADLIDGFVLDSKDAALSGSLDCPVHITDTLMQSLADRERLAGEVLAFADRLRAAPGRRVAQGRT